MIQWIGVMKKIGKNQGIGDDGWKTRGENQGLMDVVDECMYLLRRNMWAFTLLYWKGLI